MNVIDEATPIEVLLVEDDPGDVLMTREAFGRQQAGPQPPRHGQR